jgi:hypothetical protein
VRKDHLGLQGLQDQLDHRVRPVNKEFKDHPV